MSNNKVGRPKGGEFPISEEGRARGLLAWAGWKAKLLESREEDADGLELFIKDVFSVSPCYTIDGRD